VAVASGARFPPASGLASTVGRAEDASACPPASFAVAAGELELLHAVSAPATSVHEPMNPSVLMTYTLTVVS